MLVKCELHVDINHSWINIFNVNKIAFWPGLVYAPLSWFVTLNLTLNICFVPFPPLKYMFLKFNLHLWSSSIACTSWDKFSWLGLAGREGVLVGKVQSTLKLSDCIIFMWVLAIVSRICLWFYKETLVYFLEFDTADIEYTGYWFLYFNCKVITNKADYTPFMRLVFQFLFQYLLFIRLSE